MGRLNHRRGRPSNYRKSLQNNEYWKKVVRKVRIRDGHQCVICKAKIRLETHHITYYVDGKSILNNELKNLTWLVTLCEDHHQMVHNLPNHFFNPKNRHKINIKEYHEQYKL